MSNYEDWNKKFKERYTDHPIKLSVTKLDLMDIDFEKTDFNEIEESFLNAVKDHIKENGKREYSITDLDSEFAVLCAFAYCASLRETDKDYTDNSYLSKTHEKLDINDLHYWDNVWKDNTFEQVPDTFLSNWKHVRYPIYHCLLTFEDWKKIYNKADEIGILPNSDLTDAQVNEIYREIAESKKNLEKEIKKEIVKIIKNWDGSTFKITENKTSDIRTKNILSSYTIEFRIYNNELSKDQLYFTPKGQDNYLAQNDENFDKCVKELFNSKKNYIFVLQGKDDFFDSYNFVRTSSFRLDDILLILTDAEIKGENIEKIILKEIDSDKHLYMLEAKDTPEDIIKICKENISFIGGLKLDRDTWLKGAGPKKIKTENGLSVKVYQITSESKKEITNEQDYTNLEEGIYKIEVLDKKREFYIKDIDEQISLNIEEFYGWTKKEKQTVSCQGTYDIKTNKNKIEKGFLCGFFVKNTSVNKFDAIRSLYLDRKVEKQSNENKLITVIRRMIYGRIK